ncbi:small glutamine-rich tetratricopeptide repeat-containing protein beta [Episyrphus balteatus]|uniref:small glutamine-rich tetratricopeptide repeat-containing protein beta n=1 Tax=Episyrphus balteatus TaxID=286459 RepID=UPI002485C42F|nr:small glutamine-rich tetratricopeptide repeat-containing protein beta [Episyrphus balteatus]
MSDPVQKLFVKSFIGYLKTQVEGQLLAADALESLEVAVQCLQAAFDINEEEEAQAEPVAEATPSGSTAAPTPSLTENEIDLFEMFQSLFIERNPKSLEMAEQIKNEGNRLMKEGKYHEALIQYNRALTFDPKNPIFYCNRAAASIRLGENERAVRDCKSALVYNPSYGKAYGRMGIAYSNLGKFDDAQAAYSKAIELEPDNQDYRTNLEVAKNQRPVATSADPAFNLGPQLSEAIGAVLSNPALRDIVSNMQINRNDPRLMSLFESMTAATEGGDPENLVNLFQAAASGFANLQQPGANDPSRQPPQP